MEEQYCRKALGREEKMKRRIAAFHSLPLPFESPTLTVKIKKKDTGDCSRKRELTRALRLESELSDLRAG